jgi:hypothetical protein
VCGFQRLGAYFNFRPVAFKDLDGNISTELVLLQGAAYASVVDTTG